MACSVENSTSSGGTMSDLAKALSHWHLIAELTVADVGANHLSYEQLLWNPASWPSWDHALVYEKQIACTYCCKATVYMDVIIVEDDLEAIDHKPQVPLRLLGKRLYGPNSKIDPVLPDVRVITKSNVEVIIEIHLVERTRTLRSRTLKTIGKLLSSYLKLRSKYGISTSRVVIPSNPNCSML